MKKIYLITTLIVSTLSALAQGTAFTYQGRLNDGSGPANGIYDFTSLLYTNATSGSPLVGPPASNPGVGVTNGLFTMTVSFILGNPFNGQNLWLELSVRTNASGSYTNLSPRQKLTSVPYASYATAAGSASNVTGSVSDSQLSANIPRLNGNAGFNGTITALGFAGDGSGLTGMNASQVNLGTLPDTVLSTNVALRNTANTFAGVVTATNAGNVFVGTHTGNGAGLTNLNITVSTNTALLNGTNLFTGTNTFAGVVIATNANNILTGTHSGNGAGLTNLNAAQLVAGTVPLSALPSGIITNTATGVTLGGTFSGNGAGLTNLTVASASATNSALLNGTNSFTGTNFFANVVNATNANNVIKGAFTGNLAGSATSFTGSLAGDVTGTQSATVVSTVGAVTAANVAAGANLANAATNANTVNTIVRRDASGNFSAGAITAGTVNASVTGNGSGLTSLNAGNLVSGTVADARLSGNVALLNGTNLFTGTNTFAGVVNATNFNNNIIGTFTGNGAGLTALNAGNIASGTVPLAQLPAVLVTNGESGINISGNFSGNGAGVTNVSLATLNSAGVITWPGNFTLASSLGVGSEPYSVAVADVNGDGRLDLITANRGGGGGTTLMVLTNNGNGGFGSNATLVVGLSPNFVLAADVNGDGKVDLISVNGGANTLTVLTNNGGGGFVVASSPGTGGSNPNSIVAVDVNNDGKPDLICANGNSSSLTVLTNNGTGGFILTTTLSVGSTGAGPVVAADVNADGKLDLICGSGSTHPLSVFTNNGSGGFVLSSTPVVSGFADNIIAADVNGDGKVDLIATYANTNTLTVLTNNGSGGFVFASSPTVGNGPDSLVAADVNGDGKVDLISANWYDYTLSVLTNNGSGGFVLASSPGVGIYPKSVVAADVNGDGKVDLISANSYDNTLSVLFNTPTVSGNFNGSFNGSFSGNFTGNVGIGKINPATALDVNGTVTATNFIGNGAGLTNVWHQGGDNVSAGQFLGSTNNQPVEIRMDGQRALRIISSTTGWYGATGPNIIGGYYGNYVAPDVTGSTISGGGATNDNIGMGQIDGTNAVFGSFSTIAGGSKNTVGGNYSTVSGGYNNTAANSGENNATVGGGGGNTASATFSTISGGYGNTASGLGAFIGGGGYDGYHSSGNQASGWGSVICGGIGNVANNTEATIPGGFHNLASGQNSFAAGQQAQAQHDGAFVWADSQNAVFASTTNNQFLIRAAGGVGINTNNPGSSSLSVYGAQTNGWPSPTTYIHNGSTAANASPALMLEGNGNMVDGVLAVRSTGSGYLARFGTANSGWLVNMDTTGNTTLSGALVVDNANANTGSYNPGLTFGSFSGEGIASKRTAGINQYGLDFYTGNASRMSIANGGNVGIGTTTPAAKLDVVGDIHASGNASFNNLPGEKHSQTNSGTIHFANQTETTVDSVTINVPASGSLFVSAFLHTEAGYIENEDFKLFQGSSELVRTTSSAKFSEHAISWVIPVSAGSVTLSTHVWRNGGDGNFGADYYAHNLTAVFLPVSY